MAENYTGCGFSLENPFCFTSAEQEFAFVDALRSPAGTRFIQGVKWACKSPRGVLVDQFCGHYLDENGNKVDFSFYADRYCSKPHVVLPPGWSVYVPDKDEIKAATKGSFRATAKSDEFAKKLRLIKTEKDFDDLYDTISRNDIRDFVVALAEGYNNHDNQLIWTFGLLDVKNGEYSSAYQKFKTAAASGIPGAQLSLAKLFRCRGSLGVGGTISNVIRSLTGAYHKSNESALYWVKLAVAQHYAPAERELETWYLQGISPGDPVENAASIYLPQAQAGDPYYMLRVSEVYRGRCISMGVSKNQKLTERDETAISWRKRAAEAGNVEAQKLMGDSYRHGWNVNADSQKAVAWYKRASDNGHEGALKDLIRQLECGSNSSLPRFIIVDKARDDERFSTYLDYYKRAAAADYPLAGFGLMYLIGQGYQIPHSQDEEAKWKELEARERASLKREY